ncbi:MAG TPA: leucyl aminopeptidase [Bacillota bacterium]
MKVKVWRGSITEVKADAVIINLFEGVKRPGGATGAVDQALGGAISRLAEAGELTGQEKEAVVVYSLGRLPATKVVVAGLGPSSGFDLEGVRRAAGWAMKAAARGGCRTVATIVHGAGIAGLEAGAAAEATVIGSLLASYSFRELKSAKESAPHGVEELIVVEHNETKIPAVEAGVRHGQVLAEATALARNLVNRPAKLITPTALAEVAANIARQGLELEVLEKADCERLGMGAFLSVARGSDEPAKLIVLRYRPSEGRAAGGPLAFVGKGLTFDSGGISLKAGEGMEAMKADMAGGAAVLGAMQAVAGLKPAVEVIAVVPATENMPSGHAARPGDVVRAMNGKTIEIISTDAEGRMILADAVAYARSLGAKRLVDLATLTGACVVALGNVRAGLFANDDRLATEVEEAAAKAGEKVWRMPLDREYRDLLKSDVAEIKNSGGRPGGAITGAHFIGEFAGDSPWVHLDIAGLALTSTEQAHTPKGATGFGVRTLAWLAESAK